MTRVTTRADLPQGLVPRDGDWQGATMTSEEQRLQREIDSLRIVYRHFLREAEQLAVDVNRYRGAADRERMARGELLAAVRAATKSPNGIDMLRDFITLLDVEVAASPAREMLEVQP